MWKRYQKIECPDGTIRFVLRNPDKAFPLYAKDYKSNIDSAIQVAKKLEIKLKGQYQNVISGLFAQIDESNKNVQMAIRAVYEDFITNPCKKDEMLTERISLILERENNLRNLYCGLEFVKQLVQKKSDPRIIDKALSRLVCEKNNSHEMNGLEDEFQKGSKNIQIWRE